MQVKRVQYGGHSLFKPQGRPKYNKFVEWGWTAVEPLEEAVERGSTTSGVQIPVRRDLLLHPRL